MINSESKVYISLLKAISEQNYASPYPIQLEAIPAILKGKDLLGSGQKPLFKKIKLIQEGFIAAELSI